MGNIDLEIDKIVIHPFKSYRRHKDLTIGELAKKMGVNGTTLSKIENGTAECSRRYAKAFEKVSGMSWQDIITLEAKQFIRPSEPRGQVRKKRV